LQLDSRDTGGVMLVVCPRNDTGQATMHLPEETYRTPLHSMITILLLLALAMPATAAERTQRSDSPWTWTLNAGAVYQSRTSLDSGGDMSAGRAFVSGGVGRVFAGRWRVGAALGYGQEHYNFSGSSGFGGLDPWDRIRELRISVPLQYFANEHWTVYTIPSLRFNAESGASLSDGSNGGLLAGAAYKISDTLSIGPGLGVFSEIEDSTSVFPVVIIDWKITDTLSLETGSGFAASRGPGLQLKWQYSPRWQFALGGRYEKTRFRLDDSGPAPDGVGQDKAFPLFALAEFAVSSDITLSLLGGAELAATLRLEDESGDLISKSDLSTAPFLGATMQVKF
jgi:outer membrane receptor protein involved in Fe transport